MLWLCSVAAACGSSGNDPHVPATADAGENRLPDNTAGQACKRDSDCPNGTCMLELQVAAMSEARPAPGGYCSASCDADEQCGQQGECSVPAHAESGLCLGSCHEQSDCREGYACVGGGNTNGLQLSGSCQPMQAAGSLGDRVAGRECADDADCLGGTCESASPLGAAYPGNYCTGRCWEDADCGKGGACLALAGTSEAGWCFDDCASDTDCERDGYRCIQLKPGFDACFPAPDPLPDHTVGHACASDADCGGNKDSCVNELPFASFRSTENIAAPDGYCTQPCSRDAECGAGGQCISKGVQGGMCLAICSDKSDCREGYDCILHLRDLDPSGKVCVPR
jgi:hypothetical protein